ncbi:MAG: putative glycosyltransferase [Phormidesmis priestleyi Ana]|uniref:Putative glycosyltransferase n=1 Tax=Phormidesmis priestleyi Ana TaxID=1666911 RepID=A0A0P8DIC9_9CYAN|nr:MAG: putative glycosyltransferase [Phormidesmis priestleyi Ana]
MSIVPLSFSIVIPTYNRPHQLANCLRSLQALDYPRDCFEVVVVDDGSDTDLADVIELARESARESASGELDIELDIQLLKQENAGPGAARNTGVAHAKGDYIAFTDDDCMPKPDWVTCIAQRLQTSPEALVGGHTLNALPRNPYSSASQQLIDYLYAYFHKQETAIRFFTSNNMGVSKKTFLAVGGFNADLRIASEDRELCDRWRQNNYPLVYAPEVNIVHAHDLSFRSFWKQHFSYGRGAFYFHTARAKRSQEKIQIEPFSFYINLLAYPLKQRINAFQLSLSGLFLLSQMAMVAGFFWEKSRQSAVLSEAAVS